MADYVNNILCAKADSTDAQERLKEFVEKSQSENGIFSLNSTVPMPYEYSMILSCSRTDFGLAIIMAQNGNEEMVRPIFEFPYIKKAGISTLKELEEYSIDNQLADMFSGKLAYDFLNKFGAKDGFDWKIKNWGCMHDANFQNIIMDQVDCFKISFETPWGTPSAWLEKVSKDYPQLKFKIEWSDWEERTGIIEANNGKLTTNSQFNSTKS